jgi:hypothetical protein
VGSRLSIDTWHSATQVGPAQTSGPSVAAPGSGKKKNKKTRSFDKSRIGGPLRQRPGARTPVASARGNSAPTPGRALSILELATMRLSAARSRSSRSASARGVTKPPGTAPPLRGGLARRRSPTPTQPQRRGNWGIKPPTKTLRVSSTSPTPSPVVTSVARSCT